jgi:hypothetical protein
VAAVKFVTRIDRGRRYYSDKPSSSTTANLNFEGSLLSEQDLVRLVHASVAYVRRYRNRNGDDGPTGVPA